MINVSDQEFNDILAAALDSLPEERVRGLQNVLVTYEDEPTPEQLHKQGVRHGSELLGLYEGIPLTKRGIGYNMVLPDKITIFKNPILRVTRGKAAFVQQVRKTLWHEIAHYYGLDHSQIHKLEK
ncbi:metallopeptidase family protein [Candidatus Saccharibacteria bacterium]|nr:metallopeptidase family protein [Candidatus Saccharibacteria bacterium]